MPCSVVEDALYTAMLYCRVCTIHCHALLLRMNYILPCFIVDDALLPCYAVEEALYGHALELTMRYIIIRFVGGARSSIWPDDWWIHYKEVSTQTTGYSQIHNGFIHCGLGSNTYLLGAMPGPPYGWTTC